MSEDVKEGRAIIKVEDVTLEQLAKIVSEMQTVLRLLSNRYNNILKIMETNAEEFNKFQNIIEKEFKKRDKVISTLLNNQNMLMREVNPIIGEFKKAQAEFMHIMFNATDRGKKFDN